MKLLKFLSAIVGLVCLVVLPKPNRLTRVRARDLPLDVYDSEGKLKGYIGPKPPDEIWNDPARYRDWLETKLAEKRAGSLDAIDTSKLVEHPNPMNRYPISDYYLQIGNVPEHAPPEYQNDSIDAYPNVTEWNRKVVDRQLEQAFGPNTTAARPPFCREDVERIREYGNKRLTYNPDANENVERVGLPMAHTHEIKADWPGGIGELPVPNHSESNAAGDVFLERAGEQPEACGARHAKYFRVHCEKPGKCGPNEFHRATVCGPFGKARSIDFLAEGQDANFGRNS